MEFWKERGLAIAESDTVKKNKLGWQVPSQSGNGTYFAQNTIDKSVYYGVYYNNDYRI